MNLIGPWEFTIERVNDAEVEAARAAGIAAAETQLKESSARILAMDELHDSPILTAYAIGWNSVWARQLRNEQI